MSGLLFNPKTYNPTHLDQESARQLLALIEFFETKGKAKLKDEYHAAQWYTDFIEFIGKENLFSNVAIPAEVGALNEVEEPGAYWDLRRINDLNEILGFYSLDHWYAWQVTVLGLGPVWTSSNEKAKALVANLLKEGGIFGFGLSEQTHGADIYSTDMVVRPNPDGEGWLANGPKYYIGNGNEAARLAVFGKFSDDDPQRPGEYVFFLADPKSEEYELEKNVVHGTMYVSAFKLHDYPITEDDILHTGKPAWDAALAAINVGKVNLGWASTGIAEHSFYEAIDHAYNRVLFDKRVTEFTHVKRILADAYARLIGMKLYAPRSADYFRSSTPEDRRFLLFNPITKMKVTMEGERVIDLLWDVIAARGFEKDTYFEQAVSHIRALPKLEGTVHVNLALVLKFLPQYLGAAAGFGSDHPEIHARMDAKDDEFLFKQGSASGLSQIGFHNPKPAFERFKDLPNVAIFIEQMTAFGQLIATQAPTKDQSDDLDFLLSIGQLFTLVVYAQLILEAAALAIDDAPGGKRESSVSDMSGLTEAHIDRMFQVYVRDFSEYALSLAGQATATDVQREGAQGLIRVASRDAAAEESFYTEVLSQADAFKMNP